MNFALRSFSNVPYFLENMSYSYSSLYLSAFIHANEGEPAKGVPWGACFVVYETCEWCLALGIPSTVLQVLSYFLTSQLPYFWNVQPRSSRFDSRLRSSFCQFPHCPGSDVLQYFLIFLLYDLRFKRTAVYCTICTPSEMNEQSSGSDSRLEQPYLSFFISRVQERRNKLCSRTQGGSVVLPTYYC